MTFSILARDQASGVLGGAAATGSLCVGGWVLRGDPRSGMSASQGSAPSTLWGADVLDRMAAGLAAADAVAATVAPDTGRAHRQLAALDPGGGTAAHTGEESIPVFGHREAPGAIVAGNLLSSAEVLDAAVEAFLVARGAFAARLLAALEAGDGAGGDARGLRSAALLVVGRDRAPLTLRIDGHDAPLSALRALYDEAHAPPYADWARAVPTLDDPFRRPG